MNYPSAAEPGVQKQGNGLAVAGFVLGITSLLFFWTGLFAVAQIVLALTFGGVGLNRAFKGAQHKGLAISAIATGVVAFVGYFVFAVASNGWGFIL
jgi:hypothetical protein